MKNFRLDKIVKGTYSILKYLPSLIKSTERAHN